MRNYQIDGVNAPEEELATTREEGPWRWWWRFVTVREGEAAMRRAPNLAQPVEHVAEGREEAQSQGQYSVEAVWYPSDDVQELGYDEDSLRATRKAYLIVVLCTLQALYAASIGTALVFARSSPPTVAHEVVFLPPSVSFHSSSSFTNDWPAKTSPVLFAYTLSLTWLYAAFHSLSSLRRKNSSHQGYHDSVGLSSSVGSRASLILCALFVFHSAVWLVTTARQFLEIYVSYPEKGSLPTPGGWHGTRVTEWILVSLPVLGHVANGCITFFLLMLVLRLPVETPGRGVDRKTLGETQTPEDYCTLWDWITFGWMSPFIHKGRTTRLSEDDVWNLSWTMRARVVWDGFGIIARNHSLAYRLWKCNSFDIVGQFVLVHIAAVMAYTQPFFLQRILSALEVVLSSSASHDSEIRAIYASAYVDAVLFFVFWLITIAIELQHLFLCRRIISRMRTELMICVFEGSMKRRFPQRSESNAQPREARSGSDDDTGRIVNLMSTDAERVALIFDNVFFLYSAPLKLLIGSIFLYRVLGPPGFAGFLLLLPLAPITRYILSKLADTGRRMSAVRDERVGGVAEGVWGVRFIKAMAFEERWTERIMEVREREIKLGIRSKLLTLAMDVLWTVTPAFVPVLSFAVYVLNGGELSVSVAFTSLALIAKVQDPLVNSPRNFNRLVQAKVSLDRLQKFMNGISEPLDEPKGTVGDTSPGQVDGESEETGFEGWIGFKKASFCWPKNNIGPRPGSLSEVPNENQDIDDGAGVVEGNSTFTLEDLEVVFPPGQLSVITGPTGCGKSALLLALLGEMTLTAGTASLPNRGPQASPTSYASQSAFILHRSIKSNILFHSPLDEARYANVVHACALEPDFAMLRETGGDETEVGGRGVNLSGGQRARIALARAVYAKTEVVFLDDVFSAVDAHTARHIATQLFGGTLLRGRTVVLVTHHLHLVAPYAFHVVQMQAGKIVKQGAPDLLSASSSAEVINGEIGVDSSYPMEAISDNIDAEIETDAKYTPATPRKMIEEEKREEGSVKWAVYKTYLKASSVSFYSSHVPSLNMVPYVRAYAAWIVVIIFLVVYQLGVVVQKYWIKVWGEAYADANTSMYGDIVHDPSSQAPLASMNQYAPRSLFPNASARPLFYITVYASIAAVSALTQLFASATRYLAGTIASRRLFRGALWSVVRAQVKWFDVTPHGRILNRLGKDIEVIDETVPNSVYAGYTYGLALLVSVGTITFVFPWFLIPAALIGYVFVDLAVGYLNTTRSLRRMESITRSPIFSDFSEVLEGIVTVRAFRVQGNFMETMFERIDLTTKVFWMTWMSNRWLLARYDVLGATVSFVTTLFALSGYVSAGTAGLCITTAMTFTATVYWVCRLWTQMELDLNSVERVLEYLTLPSEPPLTTTSPHTPAWGAYTDAANLEPSTGSEPLIQVQDLSVKYSPDLPAVLKNLSFEVKAGEKVGIVGRTGSGKSTLALSLLRFVEPAGGRISINGVHISTIGVHDLRSRLVYIPQDAALFSGTVRENLDPFGEYTDVECLEALYRVHPHKSSLQDVTSADKDNATNEISSAPASTWTLSSSSLSTAAVSSSTTLTLSTRVAASGSNLSQGQKQLVSLARAMLAISANVPNSYDLYQATATGGGHNEINEESPRIHKPMSPIVILDEATSSVDLSTEEGLRAIMKSAMNGCTVLCVAHRLRTVIDYDKIIVLDKGKIMELDTPLNLIQKEGGLFREMCVRSGELEELRMMADRS